MRPGSKQRSIVWEHFKKNADGKIVICQVCKKEFKHYGNTTNLKGIITIILHFILNY